MQIGVPYLWLVLFFLTPFLIVLQISLAEPLLGQPLEIPYTPLAVYIGIVYLPFMVLPLYATLARLDRTLLEAAADLGARPRVAFLRVTLPLPLPGIIAGGLLVFIPAVGEFVIPDLLGGPDSLRWGACYGPSSSPIRTGRWPRR
jgi:putrescine transport system permease protein